MWYGLSVTCDISVVFSGYSGFLHQKNWPSRYNWNIVESGVKHHKTNQPWLICYAVLLYSSRKLWNIISISFFLQKIMMQYFLNYLIIVSEKKTSCWKKHVNGAKHHKFKHKPVLSIVSIYIDQHDYSI